MRLDSIRNFVVAGAGVMGASIAQILAQRGYPVTIYDLEERFLDKGRTLIHINQQVLIASGDITPEQSEKSMALISYSCNKNCFVGVDFVIEAIIENMDAKHSFWREISELVPGDAVLTSNTSGLSLTEIAKKIKNPERFAGMHWLNPPHIIPLIEVISGEKTSKEYAKLVYNMSLRIGKKPVMLNKDAAGFIVNRIQFAALREALNIVDKGIASLEDVDNVFKYGLGMRYACFGPFEIADLGGLDTFYKISSYLFKDLSNDKEVSPLLENAYINGNLGVKSGKGFYDYSNGKDKEIISKRDNVLIKLSKILYNS
jgi:3-hydroxybutyryl-CoA dehydrogenase